MKTVGATTFMIGFGQAMFQFYLLFTAGYWSRFTIADLLAEFGIYRAYGVTWWDRLVNAISGFEFSFTLLFVGTLMVVSGPLWNAFQAWQASRLIKGASRRRVSHPA